MLPCAVLACGELLKLDEYRVCSPGEERECSIAAACSTGTQFCGTDGSWSGCEVDAAGDCGAPSTEEERDSRPGGAVPASAGTCAGATGTGPSSCASSQSDDDCDGVGGNVIGTACRCTVGAIRTCEGHGRLDGVGACHAGQQSCELGPEGSTSDWGPCSGSVGPLPRDSCEIEGDDADCDGVPNDECPCIEGQTFPCGPETDDGVCAFGVVTCVGGRRGSCEGAVLPGLRDCTSSRDNDCDGVDDDVIDAACRCEVGATQACQGHGRLDGVGECHAGQQVCVLGPDGATTDWGECTDSVGPTAPDCGSSRDFDCDGEGDDERVGAGCEADAPGVCGSGELACQASTLVCLPGEPDAERRDACDGVDNDCDGQVDERDACRVLTAVIFTLTTGSDGLAGEAESDNGALDVTYVDGSGSFQFEPFRIDAAFPANSTRVFTVPMPSIDNAALRAARISAVFGSWTVVEVLIEGRYTDGTETLAQFSGTVPLENPFPTLALNFLPTGVEPGPCPPDVCD